MDEFFCPNSDANIGLGLDECPLCGYNLEEDDDETLDDES